MKCGFNGQKYQKLMPTGLRTSGNEKDVYNDPIDKMQIN